MAERQHQRPEPEPEQEQRPYVCEHCSEVWPTSRSLAGHMKAHGNKGKAPQPVPVVVPSVPPPMVPVVPPYFLQAPPPVMALGLGLGLGQQPVAPPPGFFLGGGQPMPWRPVPVRARAPPPPRDPVVSGGAGGTIRMVVLQPNHAFWALYRMGIVDGPEEVDFVGLPQQRRPESPSPSFESWFNNA